MLLSRHKSFLLWSIASLIVVGLSGCQSARLTHFDSRDFEPVFEVDLPESAYVAVDSCATGIHAIVELELDSDPGFSSDDNRANLSSAEMLPLTLTHGDSKPIHFQSSRLEGPTCMPVSEMYGARQLPMLADPTTACIYVYHAEFQLASLPKNDHNLILHYGGQQITLLVKR